jgi:3-oxoacyl-[acyl-carrier protein] reductase
VDLGIRGRVALVCGASRGIAYAVAEDFAREGVSLVICSRDEDAIESAAERLSALGAPVTAVVADLSTADGIARVVADTMEAYPDGIDILITNTGGPPSGPRIVARPVRR